MLYRELLIHHFQTLQEDSIKVLNTKIIKKTDDTPRKVIEYYIAITNEKNCLYGVFAFDLETCNVENQQYC